MRFRTPVLTFAALALMACVAARAQAQQQEQPKEEQSDQQVIEDFVTTRGVIFEESGKKPKKPAATPPRRNNSPAAGKGSGSSSGTSSGSTASKGTSSKSTAPKKSNTDGGPRPANGSQATTQAEGAGAPVGGAKFVEAGGRALGLGYTILMKDDAGQLFVTDASREFKTGEQFALALEPNEDGYIYIFSAENGRNPELLFPDPKIDGGANSVQAHARVTFPTGPDAEEAYTIGFTPPPATEHLFIILSRRPLADVPTGEALVKACKKRLEDCAWKPSTAQWERILGGAQGRGIIEAKSTLLAQGGPPTGLPEVLNHRGLKIKKDAPAPAIVRVNGSPDADTLVTEIVLTHK